MFKRRKRDTQLSIDNSPDSGDLLRPESQEYDATLAKLRDIISTLIDAIRHFTENSEEINSEKFKMQLDYHLAQLRKTSDVQVLTEIEETIKTLIFRQREAENAYTQSHHAEFSKIVETLIEGINELTSDNSNFNNQLDVSLSQVGRAAELENLKQIRYQIRQVVAKAKRVLQEKQERDGEKQQELSQKVEALESQLSQAEAEIRIDGLTKVFNRRAFDERIQEEVRRSQVLERGFGLVLFDIDHFKHVNDTHGHPIGDRILIALAKHAKVVFRVDDFIARYGGEEFAVILQASSIEIVQHAAERLRESIAQKEFRYQQDGRTNALKISISGGVAWFRDRDTDMSLIGRADQCLYLAKGTGRNQIRIESDLDKV